MKPSEVYAFTKLPRAGGYIVIISVNHKHEYINCLGLPDISNEKIPYEDFYALYENQYIEKIDDLPKNVFAHCVKEYYNNENQVTELIKRIDNESISGRKQRDVESPSRK